MNTQVHNAVDRNSDRVYHIVLVDEGVYLLHRTNTDGMNDYAGGSVQQIKQTSRETVEYSRQLDQGIEPLSEQMTGEMLKEVHSVYITFHEILRLEFNEGDEPTLMLQTTKGNYLFEFPHSQRSKVDSLAQDLRTMVDRERTGRQAGE